MPLTQSAHLSPQHPTIKTFQNDATATVAIKHLKNRESDVLAIEVAAKLDPDNFARQEQLEGRAVAEIEGLWACLVRWRSDDRRPGSAT